MSRPLQINDLPSFISYISQLDPQDLIEFCSDQKMMQLCVHPTIKSALLENRPRLLSQIASLLTIIGYAPTLNKNSINFLIELGMDPGLLLSLLIRGHATALALYILESGVKINLNWYDEHKLTLLQLAILYKEPKVLEELLRRGADPNHPDPNGGYAIITAVQNDIYPMVEILLKYGANPNVENFEGYTPLMLALHRDNIDIFKLLLRNGANVNYVNKRHRTVKHEAYDILQEEEPENKHIEEMVNMLARRK